MKRMRYVVSMLLLVVSAGIGVDAQTHRRPQRTNDAQVRQIIHRIETHSDDFRNSLAASSDRNRIDATGNDNVNTFVGDFSDAVKRLHERFDRREASNTDVQEVLDRASRIDSFMQRNNLDARTAGSWATLRADLTQLAGAYGIAWQSNSTTSYPPNQGSYGASRLTGTYRIDQSRSDDARQAAERATRNLRNNDRQRTLDVLTARLESPAAIALEVRGRNVSIASSRAPQITFEANGNETAERTANGRTARVRASLSNDQLIISSDGNRDEDFSVTFDSIDNGRRLRVTRRISDINLSSPVVVQSIYERTSDVAQFNIYTGSQGYPTDGRTGTTSGNFVIPDGTQLVAVLNESLSTTRASEGQTFTMTVRDPRQYDGATIEGHVTNVKRSGRATGRSEMTLNFDTIRLRDGGAYRFAGVVSGVRTPNGETVRVDNEGAVQDSNQTTKTEQRAAIGTAVGAVIGAIAGGGKGAVIGAVLGAGGGAGSVYAQGRNDLDLVSGTEVTVRASAPR